MEDQEKLSSAEIFILTIITLLLPLFLFFVFQLPFLLGSCISTGSGQYTGSVVETRHHGILFKTYAVQLKTNGYTPKFEDFCILDKEVYDKLSNLPRNKEITVNYKSKLSTPSWQCDASDSSDIITSFKMEG